MGARACASTLPNRCQTRAVGRRVATFSGSCRITTSQRCSCCSGEKAAKERDMEEQVEDANNAGIGPDSIVALLPATLN